MRYLHWKNDGNCCGRPAHLWGQRLSGDGTRLTGAPSPLLTNTEPWQGTLIEAPEMVLHAGTHYLFYTANDYASDAYAVGYATCTSAVGPCHDASRRPLVATSNAAAGPGHCFIVPLPSGQTVMLLHAWRPDAIASTDPGRQLWLTPLHWTADGPTVPVLSRRSQRVPGSR